jgi:hypothetical protein
MKVRLASFLRLSGITLTDQRTADGLKLVLKALKAWPAKSIFDAGRRSKPETWPNLNPGLAQPPPPGRGFFALQRGALAGHRPLDLRVNPRASTLPSRPRRQT